MFLYETNAEIVNLEKALCFLKYVQTRKELKWYHHIIGEIMSQQDIPDVTKQTSSDGSGLHFVEFDKGIIWTLSHITRLVIAL